jgi:PAS domain S-box-containing protein
VLAVAIVIEALSRTRLAMPDPDLLYLLAVVVSIYLWGVVSGIVSGVLALLLATVLFSIPGPLFHYVGDDLENLLVLLVATPLVVFMVGVLKRRDERRAGERARVEVLEQFREMVEDLDAIVWERDPATLRLTYVSRHAEDLLGFPIARWLEEPDLWSSRVHPDDRARVVEALRAALERGTDCTIEYRVTAADGRVVWLRDAERLSTEPEGLRAGRARSRLRGVVVDITERRRAEEALRESEGKYRVLMEQASDGILVTDLHANFLDVNTKGCEILGYARDELLGLNITSLFRDEDSQRIPLRLEELRAGLPVLVERWVRRKDGSLVPVEISAKRLDANRLVGIYRDISERKRAEEELRQALSVLSATLDATYDGILVVDRMGRIASFNSRFVEMWRIPDQVVAARDDNRAITYVLDQLRDPGGFIAKVRELYAAPDEESYDVLEFKDGRVFERFSKPQRIGGESVGRVWSFRDVTERRRTELALRQSEEQLRQAQKMEAIGRLAGGVAHDFNNLLTAILGNSSLLLDELPAVSAHRVGVEEILRAAERAAELTRQLLAFSRKQMLETRVLDLNTVVADMQKMLERLIGEHIELVVILASGLERVRADRGQIEQVILNLAVNARDAMPRGGRLMVETVNLDVDESFARDHPPLKPGRHVMLTVSDNGLGMDEDTVAHVFEPFFTTKERGKGTGLGLSTVYGIVRQSEGSISVSSRPDLGSTFRIVLPRVDEPETAEVKIAAGAGAIGNESVLLVEDESVVRALVRSTLLQRGYRVLEGENGAQALEIAERQAGAIDLLITDVVMPGMNGRELAERLLEMSPGTGVLFISGYTDESIAQAGVFPRGTGFLQKPFTLESLARKVREILDAAHDEKERSAGAGTTESERP